MGLDTIFPRKLGQFQFAYWHVSGFVSFLFPWDRLPYVLAEAWLTEKSSTIGVVEDE